jgi:hypothetical protein
MYVVLHFFLRFHFPWSCITAEFANIDDSVHKKAKKYAEAALEAGPVYVVRQATGLRNLLEAL